MCSISVGAENILKLCPTSIQFVHHPTGAEPWDISIRGHGIIIDILRYYTTYWAYTYVWYNINGFSGEYVELDSIPAYGVHSRLSVHFLISQAQSGIRNWSVSLMAAPGCRGRFCRRLRSWSFARSWFQLSWMNEYRMYEWIKTVDRYLLRALSGNLIPWIEWVSYIVTCSILNRI